MAQTARRAETPIATLDNARDLHRALARIVELADAPASSTLGLERAALIEAVEAYERRCSPLRLVSIR
jgi:hypothetical protein